MKKISRLLYLGTLTLVLFTAACSGQGGTATPAGTVVPDGQTSYPPPGATDATFTAETATAFPDVTETSEETSTATTDMTATATTDTTLTPGVPVTGADVILLECQYCIEKVAHALLVLPDTATYEVVADTTSLPTPGPDMGCQTVDTFNGRQTVLCRGEENTSLNLNICTDRNNCTQLLVELHSCPVTNPPVATNTPGNGLPTNTPGVGIPTDTPGAIATDTPLVLPTNSPNAGGATATP